jgi:uridine phosphorylase
VRYITPEILIRNRIGDNSLPQWFAAVLSFHGASRSHPLIQQFDLSPLGYRLFAGIEPSDVYEADVDGKRIGVLAPCRIGGPSAAILVEELAYLGVKYLIGYGPVGSISPQLHKGQQFVAKSGLITDGTSRIYCPNSSESKADPELMDLAINVGKSLSHDIKQVTAATVDAVYRETEELLSNLRSQGAQVINMEISPFYAASRLCGIRSVWIGHISDRLVDGKWESWFSDREGMSLDSARICKELVRSLIQHCHDRGAI